MKGQLPSSRQLAPDQVRLTLDDTRRHHQSSFEMLTSAFMSSLSSLHVRHRFRVFLLAPIICFSYVSFVQVQEPFRAWMVGWLASGSSEQGASWQELVRAKLQNDQSKIPAEWLLDHALVEMASSRQAIAGEFIESLLDGETLAITSVDMTKLLALISNGTLTSEVVVTAFCKRAAFAHQLV